jgi:hypothetical protein
MYNPDGQLNKKLAMHYAIKAQKLTEELSNS